MLWGDTPPACSRGTDDWTLLARPGALQCPAVEGTTAGSEDRLPSGSLPFREAQPTSQACAVYKLNPLSRAFKSH